MLMHHYIQHEKYTWALAYIVDVELRCPSMTVSPWSNKTNTLGSHFPPLAKHLTWPPRRKNTPQRLLCWPVQCLACWLLCQLLLATADYCCTNPNKDFWDYYFLWNFLLSTLYSFAMFTCFSPAQKERQFSRGHFGRQNIYWHFIAWSQKVKRRFKERFRPRRVGWRQDGCLRPCHL